MDPGSDGNCALSTEECFRLLATTQLGRLALSHQALPTVLPVSSILDRRRIIIQATPGSALAAARRGSVVAFEADDIDPRTYLGWTVVVTGHLHEVTDPTALMMYAMNPVFPRINAQKRHFLSVTPRLVSGTRRLPALDDVGSS
jgi:uncharacterized protein